MDGIEGAVDARVVRSQLLDVSELDFTRIAALPDCVLRESVLRVLGDVAGAPDRYAAHESSL